jgi:2-dehydro-3-deoxygluconokinase
MVTMLTLGETMGVAATTPGTALRTATQLRLSSAGAESTVAIGMRRLGHTAAWLGTVGADEIGRRVIRDLAAEGVDTRFTREIDGMKTGFMLRDHRTPDHVSVDYYRAGLAGAQLHPKDVDAAFAAHDDIGVIHLTGITPALSPSCNDAVWRAIELAEERGITVSFDVNYRRAVASAERASREAHAFLPHVDILFVGDDELQLLNDTTDPAASATRLAEAGPAEVVVKLGPDGAFAASEGAITHVDALSVTPVDVIGAGDSFVAGYLAARAYGLGIAERLDWATTCAACTVGTNGDWEGLPDRHELQRRRRVGQTIR